MAHPAVLRDLLEQYETLRAQRADAGGAEGGDDEVQRRLDDVSYTLCVSTGTQHLEAALTSARQQLADGHR